MKTKLFLFLSFFLSCFSILSAWAENGAVRGVVREKASGVSLPSMTVRLREELPRDGKPGHSHRFEHTHEAGSVTDRDGRFEFSGLHGGLYRVTVSGVGFALRETVVEVKEGQSASLTVELDEALLQIDEVVVSANRNAVSRKAAPVVVGVLNAQLFEKTHSVDLAQGLNYQSGLRVENNCQNCGFPQVRINGLDGPYSQILIDSRPVLSALSGVYGLEQIPVNMVDRVEVVRGGGSALFGSNAVAGTVNIITKDPVSNAWQVGSSFGMLGNKAPQYNVNANAALAASDNRSGLSLYLSCRDRDHLDIDGDGFSEIGMLTSHSFGLRGYLRPTRLSKLTLEYHTTREFRRGGNRFDLPPHETDITEQTDHTINGGGVTYDLFWDDYRYKLSFYGSLQHVDRRSYYGAGQDPAAYGKTTDFTWVAGSQFVSEFRRFLLAPATLTAGIEYQSNRLHDRMPGHDRETKQEVLVGGGFLQNEWKGRQLSLLLGLRLDKHNRIDRLIASPRVNLLYKPSDAVQGRLTFSTGFRAPQAYDEDLHVAAVGGNPMVIRLAPGLREERSLSYSGSVDLYRNWGAWQANLLAELFYTELRDVFVLEKIGEEADGTQVQERRNGKGARVYGVNLDGKLVYAARGQLQVGFTVQRSRYDAPYAWSETAPPVRNLLRTPDCYGYATFSWSFTKAFQAALTGTYTGRMYVGHFAGYIAEDRLERTSHFYDLNLKLSYDFKLAKRITLQINGGVQNVLDSRQHDYDRGPDRDSKYFYGPLQPRTWFVGVKFF